VSHQQRSPQEARNFILRASLGVYVTLRSFVAIYIFKQYARATTLRLRDFWTIDIFWLQAATKQILPAQFFDTQVMHAI
jgi:hypothetical protein